jgi:hypothetical protein
LQEDERQELSTAEDLLREACLHPDSDIRMEAKDILMNIIEHRRDHNIFPPISDILPEGLESLARRAQRASEIHTDALQLRLSMISKPGEAAKVVDYGQSPKLPLKDHFDWGDWVVSCIM